jgi:hypothetical protein
MEKKIKEDRHSKKSKKPGLAGKIESILRSFAGLATLLLGMIVAVLYVICITCSLIPSILFVKWLWIDLATSSYLLQTFIIAFGLAMAALLFMFSLILVVPAVNFLLPLRIKPSRSTNYSLETIPWYIHNALVQLVRYTVLDFLTPTPFNILFFRLMGMKIGKGVQINTSNISDPALIQIDDYVTLGGSCTVFAHYGMAGYLIVSKVHIKKNATIGLGATIMGDVEIGENVIIPPNQVVLPKTRIPDHIKN